MSTPLKPHLPALFLLFSFTPILIQPLYSLSMTILSSAPPVRDSNGRAGSEWWAKSGKPPECYAQTAQQDGYAGRCVLQLPVKQNGCQQDSTWQEIYEMSEKSRWMNCFWICLVKVIFFHPLRPKSWSMVDWLEGVLTFYVVYFDINWSLELALKHQQPRLGHLAACNSRSFIWSYWPPTILTNC